MVLILGHKLRTKVNPETGVDFYVQYNIWVGKLLAKKILRDNSVVMEFMYLNPDNQLETQEYTFRKGEKISPLEGLNISQARNRELMPSNIHLCYEDDERIYRIARTNLRND